MVAAYSAKPKFAVKIRLEPISTEVRLPGNCLFIDTFVTNTSTQNEEIIVWTQSGWSWLSSNPSFMPGTEALKNSPAKITLKPGQQINRKVEIWVDANISNNRFKLGFVPVTTRPVSEIRNTKELNPHDIYWSNSLTYSGVSAGPR